jgi:hypothetical protein
MVTLVELKATCRTDKRGKFRFSHIPPGTYTVRASLKGYLPSEMTESFTEDEISEHNFFLEEAPHFQKAEVTASAPRSDSISEVILSRFGLHGGEEEKLRLLRHNIDANPGKYQVTLRRDGTATFHGEANVAMLGDYTGVVGREDFRRFASLLVAMNYFTTPEQQGGDVIFPGGASLAVKYGGKTRQVDRDSRQVTLELWGLEAAIDGVASDIKWQKVPGPK